MSASRLLPATSLTGRLTLIYALAFYLLLGATFVVLYLYVGATLNNRMDEDLTEDAEEFAHYLASGGLQEIIAEMDKEASGGEEETVLLQLFGRNGSLVHSTDLDAWHGYRSNRARVAVQFDEATDVTFQTVELDVQESDSRFIYSALSPEYVLSIGESNHERDDVMELLAIAFTIVFVVALPLATLLVLFLTRHAVAGITTVSEAAVDIKSGNLDRRVEATNQVIEVQTLADTFDEMADRIQALIGDMREMTDNIAHDLRSPLGRIRLLAESIVASSSTDEPARYAATDTVSECDRLIRMINVSLDVAETEAGVGGIERVEFNFTDLVEDACELFDAVAEQKGLVLNRDLQNQLQVIGDCTSLQRTVANLLDNAVKFTPSGGEISVTLKVADNRILMCVRDTGIGIDASDHEGIFNRFYRVDPSRSASGCGLGLSYVRAVIRAHCGDISIQSTVGEFTEFRITLPLPSDYRKPFFTLGNNSDTTTTGEENAADLPNDHSGVRVR